MKKLILFDMDGTLLDSVPSIAACCNRALEQNGLPVHPPAAYNGMVGWGVRRLITLACPPDAAPALREQVLSSYNKIYLEECRRPGRIYPGLAELLRELREMGILTAVISNKPEAQATALFHSTFEGLLDAVWGQREGFPLKPDPTLARELTHLLDAGLIAYVGDSAVDLELGKNLGVPTFAVTWGSRTREELSAAGGGTITDTPEQLRSNLFALLK